MLSTISTQSSILPFLTVPEMCRIKVLAHASPKLDWLKKDIFLLLAQIQGGRVAIRSMTKKETELALITAAVLDHTVTLRTLSTIVEFPRILISIDCAFRYKDYSTGRTIVAAVPDRHFDQVLRHMTAGGYQNQLKQLTHIGNVRLPRCPKPPSFLQDEIWEASSLLLRKHFPDNSFSNGQCCTYSVILFVILFAKFKGVFRNNTFFIKIGGREGALRLKSIREKNITRKQNANHYYLEFNGRLNIDPAWKQFVYLSDKKGKADAREPLNPYLRDCFPDIMIANSDEMQRLMEGFAAIIPPDRRDQAQETLTKKHYWKDSVDVTWELLHWLKADAEGREDDSLDYTNFWPDIQRITGIRHPGYRSFYSHRIIKRRYGLRD